MGDVKMFLYECSNEFPLICSVFHGKSFAYCTLIIFDITILSALTLCCSESPKNREGYCIGYSKGYNTSIIKFLEDQSNIVVTCNQLICSQSSDLKPFKPNHLMFNLYYQYFCFLLEKKKQHVDITTKKPF